MKVSELYNAVALLGFEHDIDEEETFYPALNTALHDIFRIVPRVKRAVLAHYPPTNLVADTGKTLYGGEVLSYSAEGAKSYYIEISGKGTITLIGHTDDSEASFGENSGALWDNPYAYSVKRGFIKNIKGKFPGVAGIKITAETVCRIKCIALYSELQSANVEDIPAPSPYVKYNLVRFVEDFAKLHTPPVWINGEERSTVRDYIVEDDTSLSLPRAQGGDVELQYIPKIHEYTVNDGKRELDVPDDYITALKLLIASYVWLDDNASRAQYYKGLYNEEIALIAAKHRDLNPVRYESINNW